MFLLILLWVANIPVYWGLAYVFFRGWDDFVESFKGIFANDNDVVGYSGFGVPTRAFLFLFLSASLVGSEYYALSKWKPQWFASDTTWVLWASLL